MQIYENLMTRANFFRGRSYLRRSTVSAQFLRTDGRSESCSILLIFVRLIYKDNNLSGFLGFSVFIVL